MVVVVQELQAELTDNRDGVTQCTVSSSPADCSPMTKCPVLWERVLETTVQQTGHLHVLNVATTVIPSWRPIDTPSIAHASMLQQWRSRVHRWHQLSRYYLNKWQYDGTKWAERVWYGRGSQSATSVASVPFMLTRHMRLDLERAGFPAHEIAALLPRTAHQLLTDKVTYTQYCAQLKEQAAANAATTAASSTSSEDAHQEIHALVQAIEAREQSEKHATNSSSSSLALVAPVDGSNEDSKTHN